MSCMVRSGLSSECVIENGDYFKRGIIYHYALTGPHPHPHTLPSPHHTPTHTHSCPHTPPTHPHTHSRPHTTLTPSPDVKQWLCLVYHHVTGGTIIVTLKVLHYTRLADCKIDHQVYVTVILCTFTAT